MLEGDYVLLAELDLASKWPRRQSCRIVTYPREHEKSSGD